MCPIVVHMFAFVELDSFLQYCAYAKTLAGKDVSEIPILCWVRHKPLIQL